MGTLTACDCLSLLALTCAAVGIMVQVSMNTLGGAIGPSRDVQAVPTAATPKLPVAVKKLTRARRASG